MEILAFGDRAWLVRGLGQERVRAVAAALVPDVGSAGLEDVVPGDGSLLVRHAGAAAAADLAPRGGSRPSGRHRP